MKGERERRGGEKVGGERARGQGRKQGGKGREEREGGYRIVLSLACGTVLIQYLWVVCINGIERDVISGQPS